MGYWDTPDYVGLPDATEHTGLLLAEDDALKNYLSGMVVPDRSGTLPVDVWFRWPEGERRIRYPFITIDFIDVRPDFQRWVSHHAVDPELYYFTEVVDGDTVTGYRAGLYDPSVSPSIGDFPDDTPPPVDPYLAYKLTYQVSVFARSALHDRLLASRFLTDVFGPRSFWIPVLADNTWRRAELVHWVAADSTETTESGSKRMFRKNYTVSIDAEIPQSRVGEVYKVLRLHTDIYATSDITAAREDVAHPYDGPHEVAADEFTVDSQ